MYDVAIVGGGPSGSYAAYLLARTGLSVVLFEKCHFPREKTCGGGVSHKAATLVQEVIDLSGLRGRSLTGSYLCFRNEHLTHVRQHMTSYSIHRSEFDQALLKAAKNVGCEAYTGAKVIGAEERTGEVSLELEDGRRVEAGFAVFAEGAAGRQHEHVGYCGARQYTMALQADVFPRVFPPAFVRNALFDFGSIPRGYAWVFPKDDRLNVGAYFCESPRIDRSGYLAFERFLGRFAWAEGAERGRVRTHPLPYHVDYGMYNTRRTVLVGDAAGATEHFYGEGLYYGLTSSRLAAEALIECAKGGGSLDRYTETFRKQVALQAKFSRKMAHFFYDRNRFGYFRMGRNRLMNHFFAQLICGGISQRQCYFLTLAALPFSLFSPMLAERPLWEVGLGGSDEVGT